jgi:hypothetical protein
LCMKVGHLALPPAVFPRKDELIFFLLMRMSD